MTSACSLTALLGTNHLQRLFNVSKPSFVWQTPYDSLLIAIVNFLANEAESNSRCDGWEYYVDGKLSWLANEVSHSLLNIVLSS